MAAEFDRVHCVERALRVGALNCIIPPEDLRPYLIGAVERGMLKVLQSGLEPLEVRYAAAGAGVGNGNGNGDGSAAYMIRKVEPAEV